jgi:SAM-dependent methyltransferase
LGQIKEDLTTSGPTWQERFTDHFYRGQNGWIDGTEEFHRLCAQLVQPGAAILEIGAGASNPTSRFLATLGKLYGVDPDPSVQANDALAEASLLQDHCLPFTNETFDCCVSNYVIEHISDPELHLKEVARVLRPGGTYVFRTPNRYHYVSLASWMTPHWLHKLLANRLRNLPVHAHDPHPTVYALNSRPTIKRSASRAGLEIDQLLLVEKEPSYGMSSRVLFLAFMGYERLVNAFDHLSGFRANIFAVLRKPT